MRIPLLQGMYGTETRPTTSRFELRSGQIRTMERRIIKNAGWYNKDGERLGWGDLDLDDISRVAAGLETDEFFVILGQQEAFHQFEASWREVNRGNKRPPDIASPGKIYIARKAQYIIGQLRLWRVLEARAVAGEVTKYGVSFRLITPRSALVLLDS